jgi:hypothetical protein
MQQMVRLGLMEEVMQVAYLCCIAGGGCDGLIDQGGTDGLQFGTFRAGGSDSNSFLFSEHWYVLTERVVTVSTLGC